MEQIKYLGPIEIKQLAQQLNLRPTKTLGQNFVHDANTVRRIVEIAGVKSTDHVLEIGPGLGSLTTELLHKAAQVTAVEIDSRLAKLLPNTMAQLRGEKAENLRVINKDAMKIKQEDFIENPPTVMVANLPYNVSVPVLLKILDILPNIKKILVMVQQEVAVRLAAEPGSKNYGIPSVKARFYGEVALAGEVSKNIFWPVPKVESSLVGIKLYNNPLWKQDKEFKKEVFKLVDAAFGQRRKTLRAALSRLLPDKQQLDELLGKAAMKPNVRGEELTIEHYVNLARIYQEMQQNV